MTLDATANVMPNNAERKDLPSPGKDLFQRVRGALVAQGSNVKAWALENGFSENQARAALYGLSDTEEARELRSRAMKAAGLIPAEES